MRRSQIEEKQKGHISLVSKAIDNDDDTEAQKRSETQPKLIKRSRVSEKLVPKESKGGTQVKAQEEVEVPNLKVEKKENIEVDQKAFI